MKKHKNIDFKFAAVNYYLFKPSNYTKTALIYSCFRQSLMRWVKQFKKNKNVKQIPIKKLRQKLIKKFSNLKILLSHIYCVVSTSSLSGKYFLNG